MTEEEDMLTKNKGDWGAGRDRMYQEVSGIELGYSYELGSGQTRIGVLTRPRKRSGTVMTGRLN